MQKEFKDQLSYKNNISCLKKNKKRVSLNVLRWYFSKENMKMKNIKYALSERVND